MSSIAQKSSQSSENNNDNLKIAQSNTDMLSFHNFKRQTFILISDNDRKKRNCYYVDLDVRKPVYEQQRRRPACSSAQTDQRLCYWLFGKYHVLTCYKQNLNFRACL